MNWTQSPSTLPAGRMIWIGDCQEGYWASLPDGMTKKAAIDDFVQTYDFAEERDGTREELEQELRGDLTVRIEEGMYADTSWIQTADDVEQYVREGDDNVPTEPSELDRLFRLIYERQPDDEDRQNNLWSLICTAVPH